MTEPSPMTRLAYAGSDVRPAVRPPWSTAALRVALVCWALPLVAGVANLTGTVLCQVTGDRATVDVFARGGALTIVVGTGLTLVGGTAVLVFVVGRWSITVAQRWPAVVRPALITVAPLASNFAAAAVWAAFAFLI